MSGKHFALVSGVFQEQPLPGVCLPVRGPSPGGLGAAGAGSSLEGLCEVDFPDSPPSPALHFRRQSRPLSQSLPWLREMRSGSIDCPWGPQCCRAGAPVAEKAPLPKRRPQAPGCPAVWPLQMGRARPCLPTHSSGSPQGSLPPGRVAAWAILWDQQPRLLWCLQQGYPRPQAVPLLSTVTFTIQQISLRRGASPNRQAYWPCPELQAPLPRGVSVPVSHS